MPKVSLDDLRRGSAQVALAERAYALCIRRDLVAEVDRLTDELTNLPAREMQGDPDIQPPARMGGQSLDDRAREIRQRLGELFAEIEAHTGDLLIRAVQDGEWRRFVNEHPAREGNARDEQVTYGICDADALIDDLGRWVKAWEGDPLAPEEWASLFAPKAAGGDLKTIASLIVQMQEASDDPKWRLRALLGAQGSSAAETSPEQ
jgi:hypothetical protein